MAGRDKTKPMSGSRPPIRILDAAGSPEEIGNAHGSTFAEEIRRYAAERIDLVASGRWSGPAIDRDEVLAIAESMLPAHEAFDLDLHIEMSALADAAGIHLAEAIIVGGYTDFVDTVRAVVGGTTPPELVEDDCTAVIVPENRGVDGHGLFGQTWDMHDLATDHVLLLRLRPEGAPPAIVFTTTGCLGQIGMNAEGVCVGINNLTATDGVRGVAWTSVVRRMLRCSDADEALAVLLGADLAGAHNFCIFDRRGIGHNVEAMPSIRAVTKLERKPIVHTNHTIDEGTSAVQVERHPSLQASSEVRLSTARALLAEGTIDVDRLMALTREPTAICQRASDPFRIESSGAVIMRPATKDFWACWGRPEENDFQHIAAPFGGEG